MGKSSGSSFWSDTTDQLFELGQSTAKASAKAVAKSFNPLQGVFGNEKGEMDSGNPMLEKMKGELEKKSSTPLNFEQLQKKYADQDKMKLDMMRNKLFQLVKSGEQKVIDDKKRKEIEQKRKEEWEEYQKKQKEEQAKQQTIQGGLPQGKVRKSIMGAHKKKAMESHQETKPSQGKQ